MRDTKYTRLLIDLHHNHLQHAHTKGRPTPSHIQRTQAVDATILTQHRTSRKVSMLLRGAGMMAGNIVVEYQKTTPFITVVDACIISCAV